MVEIVMLLGVFVLATAVAKYRGRKGPVFGAAAVMAYFAGIVIGPILIAILTGNPLQESNQDPVVWRVLIDEYYRTLLICGLGASLLVMVVTLLLPRPVGYSGQRPTSHIPYSLIGVAAGTSGVVVLSWTKGSFLGAMWGFAMIAVAGSCFNLARRKKARSGEVALSTDNRPPVLFLRSFRTDLIPAGSRTLGLSQYLIFHPNYWRAQSGGNVLTLGELLQADVETHIGPFIALGDPNDYLPGPGPAKVYRANENWRDAFAGIAKKSQAIIVVEGRTEGLTWELSYLRSSVPPEKIFFVTHPLGRRTSQYWEDTRNAAREADIELPASDPGPGAVLAFNRTWMTSQIVTGAKTGVEYVSGLRKHLSATGSTVIAVLPDEQIAG
jgi:hypothetical protein